jgi:peptidoglycan biosynthesis protein MviN/MurJ (putative lipid II flippase)
VQRLFFMFPTGLPGIALLLLRASVAAALLAESYNHREHLSGWLEATAILISVALSVGCLTPAAAAISVTLHVLLWLDGTLGSTAWATVVCIDAIALALLGPGAYSFDSYRFGRRVVVLPPT